jgi:hypothetical protein
MPIYEPLRKLWRRRARREAMFMRKTRYCDQETVFAHIWDRADPQGLWEGDASTLALAFGTTEDEAHQALSDLCDHGLIESLLPRKYAIVRWQEREDPGDEELLC